MSDLSDFRIRLKSEPRLNDIIVQGSSIPEQHMWEIFQVKSFQAAHINAWTWKHMYWFMIMLSRVHVYSICVCVQVLGIVEMCAVQAMCVQDAVSNHTWMFLRKQSARGVWRFSHIWLVWSVRADVLCKTLLSCLFSLSHLTSLIVGSHRAGRHH